MPSQALHVPDGLPRNYLQPCLLLLLDDGPAHGYELLERLADLGMDRTDPGGLYRALRAMDEAGLVVSYWEQSTAGPARRTYDLTDDGHEWLHAWAKCLRETSRFLEEFLRRYEDKPDRTSTSSH